MSGQTNFERAREFARRFELPCPDGPGWPTADNVALWRGLIAEESQELDDAIGARDLVEVADALTDIAYVVYGMANQFGFDADAMFAEVHRSNMSKLGADGRPIRRADGKVLKGPDYSPPDLRPLVYPHPIKGA